MIVNLTPHEIVIYDGDEVKLVIPPSGRIARVTVEEESRGVAHHEKRFIPMVEIWFGLAFGLPADDPMPDGTYVDHYVVSSVVAQSCRGARGDLLVPHDLVRDDQGRVIGCRKLAALA